MEFLPIYVALRNQKVLVAGGGPMAVAKIKLLLKTPASLEVYALEPDQAIRDWHQAGRLQWHQRQVVAADLQNVRLIYSAQEDSEANAWVAQLAKTAGILINTADDIEHCDFITPAVVDRDPLVVAIGTEGASPILARAVKARIEALLPTVVAAIAARAKRLRERVKQLPEFSSRVALWHRFFGLAGFDQNRQNFEHLSVPADPQIDRLFHQEPADAVDEGRVDFVGAGPGDPDLMTLKARKVLDQADVVIHDRLVSGAILDLARREATLIDVGKQGFGPSVTQAEINALIIESARAGKTVARLKGGDPTVFGRLDEEVDACRCEGIPWSVIPGITASSAASAVLGRSLSQRGRNTAFTLMTGHATDGFAEHDWQRLAGEGQVAAIYMGRKAARYFQGRLLMHGADPETPVSVVFSASMPDQRTLDTHLGQLVEVLDSDAGSQPLMLLYGVGPSAAINQSSEIQREEASHGAH